MKSEKEKMLSGELYNAMDPELTSEREAARDLLHEFNTKRETETTSTAQLLKQLMPESGENIWIQPPFYCDYGYNIKTGKGVFFNFNCVVLDVMPVTIGHRSLIGPNVQIYTATHPLDFQERASGLESAKPIHIGDDVWIGGSVVICPGVTIGNRSVIGAGSVVTRDIPDDTLAAGNPCKIIRKLI
ncbi:maltose O-acetyltransferase [Echinicola pacifica]|uniref:Maltose O-acetyltransferase n=1 Tax=Echinicola pacifica TaxID=346377 RepID=A0A918Q4J2_9BACT|nr:sugar O-acetyltransferase [Echinicola pacifica]GGZ31784.1 maltose O-acetyltransferase [Echinicola pacifica]